MSKRIGRSGAAAMTAWALILLTFTGAGCAVRRTTRVEPVRAPSPEAEASLSDLLNRIKSQNEAIRTLTATVDFQPTAGSVYSGVIREYHDVRGFILLESPSMIRLIGQAPVVRTTLFDMVSDGQKFQLYLAPKQKFIIGKNNMVRPAKNQLENMRPQHILQAMLIPAVDPQKEMGILEEAGEDGTGYYVVSAVKPDGAGELNLERKVWFDRANLEITRLQLYGPKGRPIEDVHTSAYKDFNGVRYPTRIEINRPVEDYRVVLTIKKATFNDPIDPDKFKLARPPNTQLVDLTATASGGGRSDQ